MDGLNFKNIKDFSIFHFFLSLIRGTNQSRDMIRVFCVFLELVVPASPHGSFLIVFNVFAAALSCSKLRLLSGKETGLF